MADYGNVDSGNGEQITGCCTTCDGSGGDVTSPETNGRCVDCMGTGHCHDAATACSADWDDSYDGIQARNRAIEAFIGQAWTSPAAEASALIEHALVMEHAARIDVPALLATVDRAYKDGYDTGKSHAAESYSAPTCNEECAECGETREHHGPIEFIPKPVDDYSNPEEWESRVGSNPLPDYVHAMMAEDQAEILRLRETIARVDRLCSRYEGNRDPLLSVSEVRRALAEPERCGFMGTAAEHRAMGCCESIHGETWRHV